MSEEDYRRLFEANPRPLFVFDRETLEILVVNDAACARYGWSREEMLRMTLRDIRPPEDVPHLQHAIAEASREPGPAIRGIRGARHVTKKGDRMEVELDVVRLVLDGRPVSLALVTDVADVLEVRRRVETIVEHSADGICIIDAGNIVVYMSPAGERLLGLSPGELIGRHASVLTHPDDLANLRGATAGPTHAYLSRARHRDGSWRWIEATTTDRTLDPAVRARVASFRDVTERVEAEKALRRSEANFRTLIERSPTLTFVHRDGKVQYVNPAAVAQLGYDTADDLVGKSVLEIVHPDDHHAVRVRMERTQRDGGGAPGEARMRRRDGSYVMMSGEGIVLDFDGKESTVVVGSDVTERNEMFARMAVADRLVSVGTLAAGVAHEINSPLSFVVSNLALIANELPALLAGDSRLSRSDLETLIADAREGAARVSAIVGDLRALSRSDEETTAAVDLAPVIASSIKMAATELRHRARVTTSYEGDVPPVEANASRLGQVFLNLLVNAAHAIGEGSASDNEVRIRARAENDDVVIEVIDTGVGIPQSVIGRIFDPFFTTKPIGVGTGLGLSICHEIVRSLGGSIRVESTPGKGSNFIIKLPAALEKASARAPAVVAAAPASTARVLMIDDEIAMGRSTQILMSREYDITPITRAKEALARIAQGERYDAIVCDLMMPEMNGVEFFQQLSRAAPEHARRVVFLTGGAFTDQAREFLAKTSQPHVEKPFEEDVLRRAIERVRNEASAPRES